MYKLRFVGYLQVYIATLLIVLGIPLFTYVYFARDLQSKATIMNRNNRGVVLMDRQNKPFFSFYEGKVKKTVSLSELPEHVPQAVIAIEDKDFYNHPGFSLRGIARSVWNNIMQREIVSGGSTITQQLVKNVLLTPEKNFLRKYQEIILAQEIERKYSKNEILEMYLNSVYFGSGAVGIEEAAEVYFAKTASELTVSESALLAGLLPAPSSLSPFNGSDGPAKVRQRLVLAAMAEQGYITEAQRQHAADEKLSYNPNPNEGSLNSNAPHFAIMVLNELIENFGEEQVARSGYKVRTTLDIGWQQFAENAVQNQVATLQGNNVSNGAAVAIDPRTGEVKALVGSVSWNNNEFGKFNIVTARRPPGSAFKPIIYAAGFEKRVITPATLLADRPTTFEGNYKPQNYDRKFRGTVTVRRALANSLNVPAVEVMEKVSLITGMEMAKRMGITSLRDTSDYGPSFVLGTAEVSLMEMASAYSAFANKGSRISPTLVLEITDKNGKNIFNYRPDPQQVIEPEVAFLVSSILSDNSARRETFGNALNISRPAAVKTGTTDNYKDAWTIGYTPQLVVASWVGNNNNVPMDNIAGSLGAAPIWRALMEEFLRDAPVEQFTAPPGVVQVAVCNRVMTEKKDGDKTIQSTSYNRYNEYFLRGTLPNTACSPATTASEDAVTPTSVQKLPDSDKNERKKESTPTPTSQPTAIPTNKPSPTSSPTDIPSPTPTLNITSTP